MAQHAATNLPYPIFNLLLHNGVEMLVCLPVRRFSTWFQSEGSEHLAYGVE